MRSTEVLGPEDLSRTLGAPARLKVLLELLGGELPAGVIAHRLALAPSTTSAHLAWLQEAGLVEMVRQGRRRTARLSRPEVAEAVEALGRLVRQEPVCSLRAARRARAVREARTCYDHLAGRLGVALADRALTAGWVLERQGVWLLPEDGPRRAADGLGLELAWPDTRRASVRQCQDWTERRPHVAGLLGAAVLSASIQAGWVQRRVGERSLDVTATGRERLRSAGVEVTG